ncbi:MAG: DNA-3-methyladenine glycosylase 2 [Oscillospiraceae bacterium]|jgi:N-glycosylase/DNA lyase|nr:DNA-3-methyladenine glycosylase 2 [Oscillospiraceae bacterium]
MITDCFIEIKNFNSALTLTGGQAFRWGRIEKNCYLGIVGSRIVALHREEGGIRLLGAADSDTDFWSDYFDSRTDYEKIVKCFSEDEILRKACEYAHGLRLLRQEPFETLISFIISQNNNIPRITGIIEKLCAGFGERITKKHFAFPTAEDLAEADLSAIGAGYRAGYINDAARKVKSGEINLDLIYDMQTEQARHELMKIKGVGEKVADCVLLFAYGKSTFPKDVHIKRAVHEFYPGGLPACIAGFEGIAQQYLFEYYRNVRRK